MRSACSRRYSRMRAPRKEVVMSGNTLADYAALSGAGQALNSAIALAQLARRIEADRVARRPLEPPLDADEHALVGREEDLVLEGEALGLVARELLVGGLLEQLERVDAAEAVRVQLLHEG